MTTGILIVWTDIPGQLVLLPVVAEAGREQEFAQHVCLEVLPQLAATCGIASAVFASRNAEITLASSARDDRSGDRYVEGMLAVEATSEEGVTAAIKQLAEQNLARAGGKGASDGNALRAAPDVCAAQHVGWTKRSVPTRFCERDET